MGMARTNETPRALELGLLLRDFRKRANLSQVELAAHLGREHHSDVSRWENGKQGIDADTLASTLDILGVSAGERDNALALHRHMADPNWLALGVGRQLSVVREYENNADRITNVQPSLVPGPLQTREYAMDILLGGGATRGQAQGWADFRMARREKILTGAVEYSAIIGEYALRYPACGQENAAEQMRQLLKASELDHITIRVVPISTRYTPLRAGSFVLIESARSKPVVHLEQLGGSSTLSDSRYVKGYQTAADILRRDAMSPAATTELIAELTNEMESTT